MNLRSIDLNLLVVLDALLEEAHVSRAADRLGLSQPATSSALERCRHLFRDALLERGKGGMRLTPRAESLREPLKNLLAEVQAVIAPPQIPLSELRQTVRVLMADYPAVFVVGPLHERLRESAPGIDLVVETWRGAEQALDMLAKGAIDLAASVFTTHDAALRREELLREHYVVAMRRDHPAAPGFDLESWIAYPHVLVSGRGHMTGPLDEALAARNLARRVAVVVPNFSIVPQLLEGSDLIAMLPSRCMPRERDCLAAFEPPIAVDGFPLHLAWHKRRDGDQAVQHVAGILRELLASDR
ncbi:LysR family transcriptional regulator [Chelativorans sp. AA-79]|uniref:LysR family transcriptional regulator n=1 Tax=Chelativorans sp. AA-79 TaxID=3028735 RepID=UPI0023F9A7BD|nr:LysR family transcriptional regulator [Chelativorans sp. AA-79]WEX07863.1 LysR substrate-binding domain-containing protein [Chelativorans sp. AA-79]